MRRGLILMAMLAAGPAAATEEYILPTLFDVTGVTADDVLNIRETPSAQAKIIGTLAPAATGVEVTALDRSGSWGQVNTGERAGWVAMRYLAYRSDVWAAGALPEGFRCGGTEPFWSLEPRGDGLVWWTPEGETPYARLEVLDTGVFRSPRRALLASGEPGRLTATVTPAQCSDGMSDMAFGMEVMAVLQGEGAPRLYTGCCQIGAARR